MYSNHQKFVIIDEEFGFLGGIDLAYNRYEEKYDLLDEKSEFFPGKDYVNPTLIILGQLESF